MSPRAEPPLPSEAVRVLEAHLERVAGLRFPGGIATNAVLERARRAAGIATIEDYVVAIEQGRASMQGLVEEVRIGETYFFREVSQLDLVGSHLSARAAADPSRRLRVWSAGCASGEEPYTLAMLAAERGLDVAVLGTDISRRAVEIARAGAYTKWSMRGPAIGRATPFLVKNETSGGPQPERQTASLTVLPSLRAHVTFRTHNLLTDPAPIPEDIHERWDAILCRNVLMYFDDEVRARVIDTLVNALAEDGVLAIGACDAPPDHPQLEPIVTRDGAIHLRRTHKGAATIGTTTTTGASSARPREPARFDPFHAIHRIAPRRPPVMGPPTPQVFLPTGPPPPPSRVTSSSRGPLAPSTSSESPIPPVAHDAHPTSEAETECLVGIEAFELGALDEARAALRRATYLDPDFPMAEVMTAMLFERTGRAREATLAYRRALRSLASHEDSEVVPLGGGATASDLRAHCERRLAALRERRGDLTGDDERHE